MRETQKEESLVVCDRDYGNRGREIIESILFFSQGKSRKGDYSLKHFQYLILFYMLFSND